MDYERFLESKQIAAEPAGFEPPEALNPALFPFQADIVRWALRRGRAAIFADCGLGKTLMQLEWARHVPGPVLILAPLAVGKQSEREGARFGIPCRYARDPIPDQITITNYEMMDHFDPRAYRGIVIDESSILKAYDGKTRTAIIEAFRYTPYRLACTATPAPNDFMELGNHAEFLGTMTRNEMLAMFFVHDGGEVQKWRLKRHALKEFWKWVCSWAVMLSMPSDLGYDDDGFVLPELHTENIIAETDPTHETLLFNLPASTLQERISARRCTVTERSEVAAGIANATAEQFIVWCNLNAESAAARKAIEGATEIIGSDSRESKEQRIMDFIDGKIRVLVTKPSIAGFGVNLQNCRNAIFLGLSDSYEQYYQATRRIWRFGQTKPVNVYIVTSDSEGAVLRNIARKEKEAKEMARLMVGCMADTTKDELSSGKKPVRFEYEHAMAAGNNWEMHLADCVEVTKHMPDDSVHYSVFSPPFASLYTYSNSARDMGNVKNHREFMDHFRFVTGELLRVLMPGRLLSFHCMNLPTSKARDGIIGLTDFRGQLIRSFVDAGFVYHSEVCIWKDPVTAMQRTKALGLLHKQLKKDSCMSRQGIADYLVTMRKPGDNPERVTHTNQSFPVREWQHYASPIWTDINPSDTLQYRSAREQEDERHICPLQLEVIRRALRLWTNKGDVVFSPFAGIGSEGVIAVEMQRRFLGVELKRSYWEQACANLGNAERSNIDLFSTEAGTPAVAIPQP